MYNTKKSFLQTHVKKHSQLLFREGLKKLNLEVFGTVKVENDPC